MDILNLIEKLESMHKKAADTLSHQTTYYTGVMDTLQLLISELKTKENRSEHEKAE
jgi:FtsZ-binding cell division protein ZapB